MGFPSHFLGVASVLIALIGGSSQDVHVGVDLVTKLSNNLIPTIFKDPGQNENVVTSPFGALSNLAMVFEASGEKTREEFLQNFNVSADYIPSLRKGFKAYCDLFLKYSNEPEAAGSFNAAAVTSSFKLNSTYKEILQKYYCANVTEEKKPGKEAVLELSNVAGVMSHWKDYEKLAVYTFLSHQSVMPFRRRDGSVVAVPMIPQVGVFKSKRWEKSRVILLPLQAKLVNLLLIIPDNIKEVDALLKKLTELTIPLMVQSLPKQELEVFIPQMAMINKNFDLTPTLMRSGIRRAFDHNKSDLSYAAADSNATVRLKKVELNAYFSTSFVALNSVSGISAPLESHRRSKRDTRKIYADQPFLFFVLQKDTQLVLLAGKVENPVQIPT